MSFGSFTHYHCLLLFSTDHISHHISQLNYCSPPGFVNDPASLPPGANLVLRCPTVCDSPSVWLHFHYTLIYAVALTKVSGKATEGGREREIEREVNLCIMSTSSSCPSEEAPFHILMSSARPLHEMLLRNDRLQNDYLARRFQCWKDGETEQDIWSAASPLERALTECCELGENDDDEAETLVRGALVKGKEGVFVRLLALHCHNAATRALALAILERTIQQDKLEEEGEGKEEDVTNDDDNGEKSAKDTETKRLQKGETLKKRLPDCIKDDKEEDTEKDDGDDDNNNNDDDLGRMDRFLAAGGLKILKQWLLDAMTPVRMTVSEAAPQKASATKKEGSRTVLTVASPTGPLLLPLLSVLTDMPFDKKLVTTVQINKQIRNLKKQLDEALVTRKVKKGEEGQLRDPVAGGLAVVEVRQMVETLMERWQERIKTSTLATADPFESLREKMRARLNSLKKYEAGESSKPLWLEQFEEKERDAKEAEELSRMTTEQRAARERQQEREELLERAQKQQNESKAKREQLLKKIREESQKRKAQEVLKREGKRMRRVRWKDGLENSDNLRKRSLLEQVHAYPKELAFENDESRGGLEARTG